MTEEAYYLIRGKATKAAGEINDLSKRAMVYHHIFTDSGGNHAFPLLAAHGALWGSQYFRRGNKFGYLMSLKYALFPSERKQRLAALSSFADAFREINRRVCVETFTSYYYTKEYGDNEVAKRMVPPQLLEKLMYCHQFREEEKQFDVDSKRKLFESFFLWEQDAIVGPAVDEAQSSFNWRCMRALSMKPVINFAYFPFYRKLPFWNFANKHERINKGIKAFELAEEKGWVSVEKALLKYGVLPSDYLERKFDYQSSALQ